jgi:ankyrin repeat protein
VVTILLDAGVPAVVRDKSGATPLACALGAHHMDIAGLILDKGYRTADRQQQLDVPAFLQQEVLKGETNVVAMLLDLRGPLGQTTLLHDAALKGHDDIIELLLKHHADVDSRNAQGATALHDAALAGQRAAAETLIKHGAAVNARDTESGATPLHRAASWNRRAVVELLLAHGADPSIRDNAGRTPADLAAQNGQPDLAGLLRR